MLITIAIVVAVIVLLVTLWNKSRHKNGNLPPGPKPLPFIGNFHQIGDSTMAVDITEIGKKYGDIFTVHFLMTPMVILNSYSVIKEVLDSPGNRETFSGRVGNYFSKHLLPHGLIFQTVTEGQQYIRNLSIDAIKQFGTALKKAEQQAKLEVGILLDAMRKHEGQAYDPLDDINHYTSNIILIMVCGDRFQPDHKILRICREVGEDFDYLYIYKRQILMEMLHFLPVFPHKVRTHCQRMTDNNHYLTDSIAEHKPELGDEPDCLYAILEKERKEGHITMDNVKGIILDCILAGVVITANVIYTSLLAMAHHPEVQEKMVQEMEKVLGKDKIPTNVDMHRLPYCQAVLLEVYRFYAPGPLPGPRTTIRDCHFRDFHIPKGTMATYNVWNVHHDESFWDKPFHFVPARFLDSTGKLVRPEDERRQRLMTFGVGRRSCVAEELSNVRVFLSLTAIVKNFDLQKDPYLPFPSLDPRGYHVQFITRAPEYQMRFVPRKKSA